MAYSASLIIESTSYGEKKQKTITDINPNARNSELQVLAQGINALTTNIYVGGTKVLKQNISESDSGDSGKTEPTLTLSKNTDGIINVNYDGDGEIYAKTNDGYTQVLGTVAIYIIDENGEPPGSGYTVTVYATATDTYSAKTATINM